MNSTGLWNVELAWYSLSATHRICWYSSEHDYGIHSYRPTCPCLIIKVLVTQVKFLKPSFHCTVVNCAFTFSEVNFFGLLALCYFHFEVVEHKCLNKITLHILQWSFQIPTWWSNTQRVSTLTIMIVPTTARTFHDLNCFRYVIYTRQSNT